MDGLPIEEISDQPYKSKHSGVMHACGHDAHVSCALAAAKLLSAENLNGKIRFLMQPAEENGDSEGKSGAFRMIEDGAMQDVKAVIGLHMDASIQAGKVAIMPGAVMAAADIFKITVQGKGGHGAYPETTIDAVVLASQLVLAIQQIVSRRISALEPAIVTVGSFHSSSQRGNVISESVVLQGTIRSFSEDTRQKLIKELENTCALVKSLGGNFTIDWELGYPATINDSRVAAIMSEVACELIGKENVITIEPKTWSEDFSMLAQKAPGAFMFLGGEIEGDRRSHHSPNFDIDESGLYIGSAILAQTAKRLIKEYSHE
jgi:amidohydrolase